MATRLFSLSRPFLTNKQSLISFLSRSYTVSSTPLSLSQFSALRFRPLTAVVHLLNARSPPFLGGLRPFSTRHTQSSLNDSSPNWSNRPPKETILLDGCDFEHWLVVMEKPDESMTRDQIIDMYIKTLAQVVGSEEEARMKIYSVSTRHYFAFGALVDEDKSYLLKELPKVRWVLPDSYLDVKNQDYGGEPFINGEAVPYDPKYHEEWVRNNAKAMERNRRNDRPRNFDRSRNFDRRRQNMQNPGPPQPPQQGMPPPPPPPHTNRGIPPSNNMGPPPPQSPPNMAPGPGGYPGGPGAPNSGWQGNPQNFPGGGYPQNSQGPPPPSNYQNYGPPGNNYRGPPPGSNPGYPQGPPPGGNPGYPQNPQGPPPPSNYQNYGPPGNNFRGPPPPGGNPYQGQGNMPPTPPGGNPYQGQGDMPPPPPSTRNY